MPSKRYRLKVATWIVVREAGEPSPRKTHHPDDAAQLALEFVRSAMTTGNTFGWCFLNTKHRYRCIPRSRSARRPPHWSSP